MAAEDLVELLRVDGPAWAQEAPQLEEHFARFGDRLPPELADQLAMLKQRVGA
jgi:phosphoenolpyruvate carboxykinase (GTP)